MMAKQRLGVRRVFVDTSAFFAIISTRDSNHNTAVSIMRQLTTQPCQLLTTNFIIAEAHALLLTRLGRQVALQFLDNMDASSTTIIRVSAADEQKAKAMLRQFDDKNFSLTDGTSFSIMERLKTNEAFAFDQNFSQYGLHVLIADS